MDDGLGKDAESKIKVWLNKPEEGYCFYRIKDHMTGFYGSDNPCDFIVYRYPYQCFLESKATWKDRFDLSMVTQNQRKGLLSYSEINGVYGVVAVLFASSQRMFIFNASDLFMLDQYGEPVLKNEKIKSFNIKKIDKWSVPYKEVATIPSRKKLLDYTGDLFDLLKEIN